jgi:3-carboxy-cis,cis-muconate cycloisomerase
MPMSSRLIESLANTEQMAGLFSDSSVLRAMLQFEVALARAQARLGMIPQSAGETIARAAVVEHFDSEAIARDARYSATVAIPFVKALTARVNSLDQASAGFVHFGATSQDVVDTALILLLRDACEAVRFDYQRVQDQLRALSESHAGTVMLARTLLQPALPTTFGYKVAGWFGAVQRSWRRLAGSFDEALQLQFGGAAGTLASYGERGPALAAALAQELALGLPEAPWHTHRDRLAAVVTDCGIVVGTLGKVARDISLLMQYEVGEVWERGGGSSSMPNKHNPSGSVLVLAAATRVPGMVSSYLSGMVQEHERATGAWQSEWPTIVGVVEAAGSAMAALADVAEGLQVNTERMRANVASTHGSVFAEKAVMALTPKVGRTAAHALVAEALKSPSLGEGLAQSPQASAMLTPDQIKTIDIPEEYLGTAEMFRRRLLEKQ